MAAAIRITQFRTPGGVWTAYPFPLEFATREGAENYARQYAPVEFLIGYGDVNGGRDTELGRGMTSAALAPPPWTGAPVESVPSLGFGGLPAVARPGSAEPNPPRFTAPGSTIINTLRSEVRAISTGTYRDPRATVTTASPVIAPVRAVVPEVPRLLVRSDISAPEPNPPRLYSPLESFPIPSTIVPTGPEPNPPAILRTSEFYPIATAAEPNPPRFTAPETPPPLANVEPKSFFDQVKDVFGEWWSKPGLESAIVAQFGRLPDLPGAAEPNPPTITAPPAPDPLPTLTDTLSDWDLAKQIFGEWWSKPGIWDQVRARFGGQLPTNPNDPPPRDTHGTGGGGGSTDYGIDPPSDPPTDPPTDPPMPDTTDPTDAATDSGSRLDDYLNSLNNVMTTVGKMVDAFNPSASASTASPPTATPKPVAAQASPLGGQPWFVWGGLGLLLFLLLNRRR